MCAVMAGNGPCWGPDGVPKVPGYYEFGGGGVDLTLRGILAYDFSVSSLIFLSFAGGD